jgi:hypothetical protein
MSRVHPSRTRLDWGVLAMLLLAGGVARAEPAPKKKAVIRLDELAVEGRIQRPQAFYVLPRSSLNYQGLDRQESFLPKISKLLEQEPF